MTKWSLSYSDPAIFVFPYFSGLGGIVCYERQLNCLYLKSFF